MEDNSADPQVSWPAQTLQLLTAASHQSPCMELASNSPGSYKAVRCRSGPELPHRLGSLHTHAYADSTAACTLSAWPWRSQVGLDPHRDALQLRHLAQDLDVSQLVEVEVPLPLHGVHLELGFSQLQVPEPFSKRRCAAH